MDYRRVGATGLRISRLGLGCGNFGGIGSAPAFFGILSLSRSLIFKRDAWATPSRAFENLKTFETF